MTKWAYIVLSVALYAAMLPVFAVMFFALNGAVWGPGIGLVSGLAVIALFIMGAIAFVRAELMERPTWHGLGGPPYTLKFLGILALYLVIGWIGYQFYLDNDTFELPRFSSEFPYIE
jgi:hypothetical protein